ncbi:MAG: choice-of-anchor B family protein [Bacteroidetes bacterium]|nr:choice-of-anchor B family protein [Bacteroidota bacterium]
MKKFILLLIVCPALSFAQNLTLEGELTSGNNGTDIWEYIDSNTGNVYAIVGGNGMSIVDVTDPTSPVQVEHISSVPGFDVKVWDHYVYCSTAGGGTAMIVDIDDPTNGQIVGSFPSGHNIFIDERGYMYISSQGVTIYDLNPDPTNPTFVNFFDTEGHDVTVRGNLMIDCNGSSGTNLYDVTDPAAAFLYSSITDPTISYHHQGDISTDGNYLYINDEGAHHPEADISVWDISDLNNPVRVSDIADPNATTHNLYVIGDYAYASYYTAGLKVFDISDPSQLVIADTYDTNPFTGEGFGGAFGVYPSPITGNIYINDGEGVFIFSFDKLLSIEGSVDLEVDFSVAPNPVLNKTNLKLTRDTIDLISVHSLLGTQIMEIEVQEGSSNYELDLNALGAGVYFVTVNNLHTKKIVVR